MARKHIPSNPESLKRHLTGMMLTLQLAKAYSPETSLTYKAFLQYMTDRDDLGSKETALR